MLHSVISLTLPAAVAAFVGTSASLEENARWFDHDE
jgi:hypothetical protein